MSAEQLIALEAALAELSGLYSVARGFTALQSRAETELLPRLSAFGSRLRGLVRSGKLTADEIDAASQQILSTRAEWQNALETVHSSALYQRALAAFDADRQEKLGEVIPQVCAGQRQLRPAPTLYFPVSPSSGGRRPGNSPFLSAPACADRIVQVLHDGIVPEVAGAEWWERELPSIGCADDVAALDTPIALRLAASDVPVAVFAAGDEPSLRIFTPRLRASFAIVLATEATDEWWEAYQDSYGVFRDALQQELAARGHQATIGDQCNRL